MPVIRSITLDKYALCNTDCSLVSCRSIQSFSKQSKCKQTCGSSREIRYNNPGNAERSPKHPGEDEPPQAGLIQCNDIQQPNGIQSCHAYDYRRENALVRR